MLRRALRILLSWMLLTVLEAVGLLRPGQPVDPAVEDIGLHGGMPPGFGRLLFAWILLIVLGGIEFGISFLHFDRSLRPLVIVPGMLMVAVVAIMFMEVGKGPVIVRGFAVAAMFWLIVLLGLGSADPITRTDYHVPHAHVN